jgi:hypothetical protein
MYDTIAYEEGRRAYENTTPCPYIEDSPSYYDWWEGFRDAEQDAEEDAE